MICGGKGGGGGWWWCVRVVFPFLSFFLCVYWCILNGMKIILLLCCVMVEGILLWYYRGCIY